MPELRLIDRSPARPETPEITDVEAAAMARAVPNLFKRWGVTDAQACTLLGGISARTWARWKLGGSGRLPRDLRARLANLMAIHKALRLIFREPERGYAWIAAPNAVFDGRSALEVMLGGELTDLMRVRRYLDAERGAW